MRVVHFVFQFPHVMFRSLTIICVLWISTSLITVESFKNAEFDRKNEDIGCDITVEPVKNKHCWRPTLEEVTSETHNSIGRRLQGNLNTKLTQLTAEVMCRPRRIDPTCAPTLAPSEVQCRLRHKSSTTLTQAPTFSPSKIQDPMRIMCKPRPESPTSAPTEPKCRLRPIDPSNIPTATPTTSPTTSIPTNIDVSSPMPTAVVSTAISTVPNTVPIVAPTVSNCAR